VPDRTVRHQAQQGGAEGHVHPGADDPPRYTALDLANETGLLPELVDELFAPGGYWAEND
jgi:hypothetical protein